MSTEQNIENTKAGYAAFATGDAEEAMSKLADDVEWIVPGESAVSGSYRGKEQVAGLWMKVAEKSLTTTPQRILGDDEVVVVLTQVTAGGESWDAADVLTFRDGKAVKIQSTADTAKQAKVFGTS
jgi:ketosteroid isomerase-like protein